MRRTCLNLFLGVFCLALLACESKRPDSNGVFTVTLEGRSILKAAAVTVLKDGTAEQVATGTTDETGAFTIEKIATANTLRVRVCGGTFYSIGTGAEVSFNGCLESVVLVKETGKETVFVDFVSTLAATYESDTAKAEVLAYLDLTADSAATEETTLTDATKRYLWQQGLSVVAVQIADANGVTPETSLSTEALFTLILADLTDNNTIDGSTGTKFGPVLPVNEALVRQFLSNAVSGVSANFKAADLADWAAHLQTAEAKFLGKGGEDTDDPIQNDTDETGDPDEETLYPDYDTVGNPPGIEITAPANNAVLFGTVAVRAQRTLDSCPLLSLTCTLKNGDASFSKDLTDTNANEEILEASVDTLDLELADEQFTLTCTGSNGVKQATSSVKFTLSNKNPVQVLVYVTDKVTGVESVDVFDAEGKKFKTLTEEAGTIAGDLPPGEYTVAVTGGDYTSILFKDGTGDPKVVTLSVPLLSRAVVEAGATTKIYVTPLTTIREIIYQGLKKKGGRTENEAIDDSLALFETHYLQDINPYIRPQAGQPAENATLNWAAIAGLEQLAADIALEEGLSEGAILMDDILVALGADLIETTALFDGLDQNEDPLKIKTFAVNSYLFRYHYAVAVKRFIEAATEYTYQDFQNLIYNIAMDDSELFPEDNPPIEVVAQAPEIQKLAFKRPSDADYIDYADPDAIPYVSSSLDLLFFVEHAETSTIDRLDLYFEEGAPVKQIGDLVENTGSYMATGIVVTGDDGEKTLTIDAEDSQGNYGLKTMKIVKDAIVPTVEVTPPAAEVISGTLSFDYTITEANLAEKYYSILPAGGTATEYPHAGVALSGSVALSEIPADGTYTVTLFAKDKAANVGSQGFTRTIDTTAPSVGYAYAPTPNTEGFIGQTSLTVTMTATDRTGATLTYKTSQDGGANWSDSANNVSVLDLDDQTTYDLRFKVADDVNNTSTEEVKAVTVDTVAPKICVEYNAASEFVGTSITYHLTEKYPALFQLYRDDVLYGNLKSDGTNGSIDMLPWTDGRYHFVFSASDKAGNAGVKDSGSECQALDFYKTLDRTAPEATIQLLTQSLDEEVAGLTWATDDNLYVAFTGVADPGRSGTINYTYHYILDSGDEQIVGPTTQTSRNFTFNGLSQTVNSDKPATRHYIKAWVEDESNNACSALEFYFFVDAIIPTLTISAAPTGAVSSHQFTYTASDSNLSKVYYTVNDGAQVQLDVASAVPQSVSFACGAGGIADGTYSFKFYAEDFAGNLAGPVARSVNFDCTPPLFNAGTDPFVGTFLENENTYLKDDMGSITITANESATIRYDLTINNLPTTCNGSLSYQVGGDPVYISCPFGTGGVDDGVYTLIISATDLAGNKSVEYSRTFTIDTLPPDLFMTGSKVNPWNFRLETAGTTVLSHVETEPNFSHCIYTLNDNDVSEIAPASIILDPAHDGNAGNDTYKIELRLWLKGFADDTYFAPNALNTVHAACFDLSGNATTKIFTWQYDIVKPFVELTVAPATTTSLISQTFNFDAGDDQYGDANIAKVEYRYKTTESAYSSWITRTINGSAQGTAIFPAATDATLLDANFWKNKNIVVTLELRSTDKAYNVSDTETYQWIVDRKSPIMHYVGAELGICYVKPVTFEVICPRILKFDPVEPAESAKIYLDSTSVSTACAVRVDGIIACTVANDGADHVARVTATDAYDNSGVATDCQADNYYCVQQNVYFSHPALDVTVTSVNSTQLVFNVATPDTATIQTCKIYNSSNVLKNTCANATGDQSVNISNVTTWPEGDYRIEVTSKDNASGNISTQNTDFAIDRTVTSFSFTHVSPQPSYFGNTKPTVHYTAAIAYGVKNVKIWLYGRKVNKNYTSAGYTCSGNYCTNAAYEQLVYDGPGDDVTMSMIVPAGGIYEAIKYQITSNSGASTSPTTYSISAAPIRKIVNVNQQLRVLSEEFTPAGKDINFQHSIITNEISSQTGVLSLKTPTTTCGGHFDLYEDHQKQTSTLDLANKKIQVKKFIGYYQNYQSTKCADDSDCPTEYNETTCARYEGSAYRYCLNYDGWWEVVVGQMHYWLRRSEYVQDGAGRIVDDFNQVTFSYTGNYTTDSCPQYSSPY